MIIVIVQKGHQVTVITQGNADYVARFCEQALTVIDAYPTKKYAVLPLNVFAMNSRKTNTILFKQPTHEPFQMLPLLVSVSLPQNLSLTEVPLVVYTVMILVRI